MKKREFLKTSVIFSTAVFFNSCKKTPKRTNWAGNLVYKTDKLLNPKTVAELQNLLKISGKTRVLGTAHCFNTIADSEFSQISSSAFNKVINLDKTAQTITVGAGIKYGEFCEYLDKEGFALFNLASLPHISVAGACATATHGSGIKNGCLASSAVGLEMITANGDLVKLNKSDPDFPFVIHSLGVLGMLTSITLKVQPTFKMNQVVYQNLPMSALKDNFLEIMSSAYSVSLFTDWKNKNISEVWIKDKSKPGYKHAEEYFGAKLATKNLHPIETLDPVNCTDQLGVDGPWYERMPHFKMGFTPSSGKELQSEYFVPMVNAYEAFMAVETLNEAISPHLMITEIRSIAADDMPLSPFYNKTCLAIHFTWKQETEAVMALLPQIEKVLEPFSVRPHWGKLFTIAPEKLQKSIIKLKEFKAMMLKYDPKGIFRNDFIDKNLFGKEV